MMYQVPAAGLVNEQVSLLPLVNGRHANALVVGGLPKRTYRSASPVPPWRVTTRLSMPGGTSMVKNVWLFRLPPTLTGMPFVSWPLAGGGSGGMPAVYEAVSVAPEYPT